MKIPALDRKLFRDLWEMKGQALAIAAVVASGVTMYVTYLSNFDSLRRTQSAYYERFRFADVFAQCKRAPLRLGERIEAIPGVARTDLRVVADVTLDVPGFDEPATGRLISVPAEGRPRLNDVFLARGRWIEAGRSDEVIANEVFADAHGLVPGDSVAALINGRRRELRIVGLTDLRGGSRSMAWAISSMATAPETLSSAPGNIAPSRYPIPSWCPPMTTYSSRSDGSEPRTTPRTFRVTSERTARSTLASSVLPGYSRGGTRLPWARSANMAPSSSREIPRMDAAASWRRSMAKRAGDAVPPSPTSVPWGHPLSTSSKLRPLAVRSASRAGGITVRTATAPPSRIRVLRRLRTPRLAG